VNVTRLPYNLGTVVLGNLREIGSSLGKSIRVCFVDEQSQQVPCIQLFRNPVLVDDLLLVVLGTELLGKFFLQVVFCSSSSDLLRLCYSPNHIYNIQLNQGKVKVYFHHQQRNIPYRFCRPNQHHNGGWRWHNHCYRIPGLRPLVRTHIGSKSIYKSFSYHRPQAFRKVSRLNLELSAPSESARTIHPCLHCFTEEYWFLLHSSFSLR